MIQVLYHHNGQKKRVAHFKSTNNGLLFKNKNGPVFIQWNENGQMHMKVWYIDYKPFCTIFYRQNVPNKIVFKYEHENVYMGFGEDALKLEKDFKIEFNHRDYPFAITNGGKKYVLRR